MMKVRWLTGLSGLGIAVVLLLMFLSGCVADKIIFQPPQGTPMDSAERIRLEVEPGVAVTLLHLPAPPGGFTILYSHGNAEDLSNIRFRLPLYQRRGYGIAAYDYEGYGQSDGTPSEANACRDIRRVYEYLTGECAVAPESIVIYGRSVGSGPSCFLATEVPAAALVLEAPFKSTFAVVGLSFLPFDRFPNIDRIAGAGMPVLIIHGDRDRVIPQSHGKALFEKAAEPKEFYDVPGAGHNDILYVAGENYWKRLEDFLNRVVPARNTMEK